jgi:hypothetical protein
MSKWRNSVIPALLFSTVHVLYGREMPAPTFGPPSSELVCPATILIVNNAVLKNAAPRALIVLTTDGSQPSPNDVEPPYPSDILVSGVTVPITKTTTVRAIAVLRADSGQKAPYKVSAESSATYTCKASPTPGATPNSAQSVPADQLPTSNQAARNPVVPTPLSISADKDNGKKVPEKLYPDPVHRRRAKLWWLWPLIIGSTILLSFMLLLLTFHLSYLRKIGREVFPSHSRMRITSSTIQDTLRAVDRRTGEIRLFLQEFDNEGGVSSEFLEAPPGLLGVERRRFAIEDPARFWHTSRLSFELEDNAYLLLERVTDAVVSFARTGVLGNSALPTAIQLERSAKSDHKFPWRVVITAPDRENLYALFSNPETSRWCGIDIEIRRPTQSSQKQGRCRQGTDGLEGVIGGVFEDTLSGERYGVTCAHVLSSTCPITFWSAGKPAVVPKEYIAERPDAAFVKGITTCFSPPTFDEEVVVSTLKDVVTHVQNETSLRKTPSNDGTLGVVQQGLGSLFKLGDVTYRGPHFVIAPKFYKQFGLVFPRSGRFSSQGDSGSWVTTEDGKWLGMIVGAFPPPNTTSLAIHGLHLLNAFSRSHSSTIPRRSIRVRTSRR